MGKGMVTFFFRGWRLPLVKTGLPTGLCVTYWTQICPIPSEFQIPGVPCSGFLPLLGTGTAWISWAAYQDGTHVQNAVWTFTSEGMSMPNIHTHVHMAQLNLPPAVTVTLSCQASMPSFVLFCVLGCAVSSAQGTPDRTGSA